MTGITQKWTIETTDDYDQSLRRLDRVVAARISRKLFWLASQDDPESLCKPLSGLLAGLRRVRVGDYRVIVDVQKGRLVILALEVGHRAEVYE